jgi:hypothetical protein
VRPGVEEPPPKQRATNVASKRHRGLSMVEVTAAIVLVGGTLVPSLAVMRDAMAVSREGIKRHLLANYGVQLLETQCAVVMRNWSTTTLTGNMSADGYASVRYSIARSDAVASGGLVNQLMNIQVTVYYDDDGDSTLDSNELKIVYRTKVAKLFSYQNAST